MRVNDHIREAAKAARVPLWKVAAELGICDTTLVRWLRFPLSTEREKQIMEAIKKVEA